MAASNSNEVQRIKQWISKIINVESKSNDNLKYLNNILGPIKENDLKIYEQSQDPVSINATNVDNLPNTGFFTHEFIFKIEEKVFINEIKIYEKVVGDSSILKIEALIPSSDKNKLIKRESEYDEWLNIWECSGTIEPATKPRIFIPNIIPTPFKTDIIKFTLSGSLHLINGIGEF
jgi:hypothetical protein